MDTDTPELPELPPGFKYMLCGLCDKPMVVGAKQSKVPRHIECSVSVAIETQRQMREKSGPYYEHWLSRSLDALEARLRGGAPLGD